MIYPCMEYNNDLRNRYKFLNFTVNRRKLKSIRFLCKYLLNGGMQVL